MAEKIVIDTSVAVKWFLDEDGSEAARGLLRKYQKQEVDLLAPDIIVLELTNALKWGGGFKVSEVESCINYFYELQIELERLESGLLTRAIVYLKYPKLAIYDSVFMALAESEGMKLITADEQHHKREYYDGVRYLGVYE